ncbi:MULTISPECIES: hypothetical protein [unclassified Lentimonas]|uniref:hypothetical protein n=1 Tax=unclassified Lentimonas TaxID=2630993 RepID=UPI0013279A9B|nr:MULTISPECIES: hypothetical protein [unclassified Lentimonas]CAA6678074.1 Unannotated [Lentimonas sp. CC4]CAA6686037.1 Unannotated [Lentimonas sp. CC6]CAA7075874.1 Unannotated [Lentimonas sp. CC4]CAA7168700.1 Unannotated [Lentimonas sp. CC21]CAA7181091.1 Unannotated [Lentimonas sp. CC8]
MTKEEKIRLEKISLETAQRLIDYNSYGKNKSKAISAMKRRISGFEKEVYADYLDRAISVHTDAIEFVKKHCEAFHQTYKENGDGSGVEQIATDFLSKHDEYQRSHLCGTLGFIFYIWHLR